MPAPSALDVGIVGAGLAGLACADALAGRGLRAAVYDASARTGSRCWSLRGRFRRTSSGRVDLTFASPGGTVTRTHDAVVLAVPFSTLRYVTLHGNLGLTRETRDAIDLLGYGTNAKMMVGVTSRPWAGQGSNGSSYSDLENHQTTWETNPARATPSRAVSTDYSGGDRGEALDPSNIQLEASRFLTDLDVVFPGTAAAARTAGAEIVAHLEHWPSNPLTRGSYTSYLPGQFTTIAGLEGLPAGNVFFAGEHTNSFYDYQVSWKGPRSRAPPPLLGFSSLQSAPRTGSFLPKLWLS